MALTPLPTPPTTSDPASFDTRADAFLGALPTMVEEINDELPGIATAATSAALAQTASEGLVNGAAATAGFVGTGGGSLAVSTGSKSLTIQTGKSFADGDAVVAILRSDAGIRMYGTVNGGGGYNSGTGVLAFTVTEAIGSGSHAGWMVCLEAFEPFQPPITDEPVLDLIVEVTPEAYAAAAGTAKRVFHAPRAYVLNEVIAELSTAQASGSIFTVDINVNGTTILSTKLTIDNTEQTSITAAVAAVFAGGLGHVLIAKGDRITIDIDAVGDGSAKGLKVTFVWQGQ